MTGIKMLYDLYERRPQVVLVGNGPFRNNGTDWKRFVEAISISKSRLKEYLTSDSSNDEYGIPLTLLASVCAESDDKTRHDRYQNALETLTCEGNDFSRTLMNMQLDAVVTTNYTYELERSVKEDYKGNYYYSRNTRQDKKYLIHTYNSMSKQSPSIWHIHGEQRNKSSIILNHDEYARLINRIIEYNIENSNRYELSRNSFQIQSWIDYFIVSDMYIVGQGFGFEEFDLWWLLSRRSKEKDLSLIGRIVYYEPYNEKHRLKYQALQDLKIQVEHLGVVDSDNVNKSIRDKLYNDFYTAVLKEISLKI